MSLGMPAGYDSWRMEGSTHRCCCGALWVDSDGGPCHKECVDCKEIFEPDELDEEERCPECHIVKCPVCGFSYSSDEVDRDSLNSKGKFKEGMCPECKNTNKEDLNV